MKTERSLSVLSFNLQPLDQVICCAGAAHAASAVPQVLFSALIRRPGCCKPPQSSSGSSSYRRPSLFFFLLLRLQLEPRSVSVLCSSCRINKSCLLNSSLVALSLTFISSLGIWALEAEGPIHLRIPQLSLDLIYWLFSPLLCCLNLSLFSSLSSIQLSSPHFSSHLSTFHCS